MFADVIASGAQRVDGSARLGLDQTDGVTRRPNVVNSQRIIMLDRPTSSCRDKIIGIVAELLARRAVTRPVGVDDDLRELLTSMDMVNLMLTVEAELDLKLPERAMTPANFRSIATIDALVADLLRAG